MNRCTYGIICLIFIIITAMSSYNDIKADVEEVYTTIWKNDENADKIYLQEEKQLKAPKQDTMDGLSLNAMSACLMDAESGRILFSKDAYNKMPMASTTKIMTLLVVLENAVLDSVVTVSKNAAKQPDVQLNINTGEQYILKDLLYSLMLESHNDSAVAIAEHVGGSVEGFCEMMNSKAKSIGAYNTNFVTPNGLDADGHYTTAADLALIASHAMKNEQFVEIVNTKSYSFSEVNNKRHFSVNNKNAFLSLMPGANGIKTGFTNKAGYCFCGSLESGGKKLISVVLASGWPPNKTYKWNDTRKLMEYGLNNFEKITVAESGNISYEIPVTDGESAVLYASADSACLEGYTTLISKCDNIIMEYYYPDILTAPVRKGACVGYMELMINDECMTRYEISADIEIEEQNYKNCMNTFMKIYFR